MNVRPITTTSADRGGPVLEPALQEIDPEPMPPLPPDVITSHGLVELAVQAQSLSVNTRMEPVPPLEPRPVPLESRLKRHVDGSRDCEMPTLAEPTVTLPLRKRPPLFAATLIVREPPPLPLPPEAIVIHEGLAEALHPQSLSVDTVTEMVPPE